MSTEATLHQAYHDIFDVKDAHLDDEQIRIGTFTALGAIRGVCHALQIDRLHRFDGEGRPENYPAFRSCNVCGAVAAIEFCAVCGGDQTCPDPALVSGA